MARPYSDAISEADFGAGEYVPEQTGLCECGCGGLAPLAKQTRRARGFVKGQPQRFILAHGPQRPAVVGYPAKAHAGRSVRIHRLRAMAALGKPLPTHAEVHHVDGTKCARSPLVICQDRAYHTLLHARTRIVRRGGNPNTDRICCECQRLLDRAAWFYADGNQCRDCQAARAERYKSDPAYQERRRAYERERRQRPERQAYMRQFRAGLRRAS